MAYFSLRETIHCSDFTQTNPVVLELKSIFCWRKAYELQIFKFPRNKSGIAVLLFFKYFTTVKDLLNTQVKMVQQSLHFLLV